MKAYAKINLGLRILRKRNDGYHDIETVFIRVNPFDEISFEPASNINLSTNDSSLLNDNSNLCLKAAMLLQKLTRISKGVTISLTKNIPIGAGLGGGSSDAATTLIGLIKLWNTEISIDELNSLAVQLGSDVPYFLKSGNAYAKGRGELLEYFHLNIPYWIVLVYPHIHVSTSWAYNAIHNLKFTEKMPNDKVLSKNTEDLCDSHFEHHFSDITLKDFLIKNIDNPNELNHQLRNDFEPVVLHEYKQIGFVKAMLYTEGACFAQMSGSGSSVYGFFTDEHIAKLAFEKFKSRYKTFITPPNFQQD